MIPTTPLAIKKVSKMIRYIAVSEGISYIILLFVAMPLKYFANMPQPVKYTGWIHGLLFILFINAIILGFFRLKWTFKQIVWAFIASLLPFGTFILDKQMKKAEDLMV
jgi:integral membrane protein